MMNSSLWHFIGGMNCDDVRLADHELRRRSMTMMVLVWLMVVVVVILPFRWSIIHRRTVRMETCARTCGGGVWRCGGRVRRHQSERKGGRTCVRSVVVAGNPFPNTRAVWHRWRQSRLFWGWCVANFASIISNGTFRSYQPSDCNYCKFSTFNNSK